jgi:hypothetical protein
LWRSRQGKWSFAAAHKVLDDVAADKPGTPYDEASRLLGFGFRVHWVRSTAPEQITPLSGVLPFGCQTPS